MDPKGPERASPQTPEVEERGLRGPGREGKAERLRAGLGFPWRVMAMF